MAQRNLGTFACDQRVRDELVQYTGFFYRDIELCLILSGFLQLIYRLIADRRIEGWKDGMIAGQMKQPLFVFEHI